MAGALRGDGQPVKLPGKADGEIADVDHLLNFAQRLGGDFPDFQGNKYAEIRFSRAEFFTDTPDEFATRIAAERARWREVIRAAGIKLQ